MKKLEKKLAEDQILEKMPEEIKHLMSPAFISSDPRNMNTFLIDLSLNIIKILEAKDASPFIKLCQNNKNVGELLFEVFNFFRGSYESIFSILRIILKDQFKDIIAKKLEKSNNLLETGDVVLLFGGVGLSKVIDSIDQAKIKDSGSLNLFVNALRAKCPSTDTDSLDKLNEDITQLLP